ncbi:MAG: hypothetical protein K9N52_09640, partial [Verrucomicrobia bacterium]|nr:hypothetical protein [Verrucomicrobiota bacterium]
DPASYVIEGSNDGETFTAIAESDVAAFEDRFFQQVYLFGNAETYATDRVTFPTVADAPAANSMQVAEVELLGTVIGPVEGPAMTVVEADGQVTISWDAAAGEGYTLEATDNLEAPDWQAVEATVETADGVSSVTLPADKAREFYRLVK